MRRRALVPSRLAAITTTLLSVLSAGDHMLVTDNVTRLATVRDD
jgi:cystathionine beta-lyase